jgi:hypothetical protein
LDAGNSALIIEFDVLGVLNHGAAKGTTTRTYARVGEMSNGRKQQIPLGPLPKGSLRDFDKGGGLILVLGSLWNEQGKINRAKFPPSQTAAPKESLRERDLLGNAGKEISDTNTAWY